jgi:alanine racemase
MTGRDWRDWNMTAGVSRPGRNPPETGSRPFAPSCPSVVEIDLESVRRNVRALRSLLAPETAFCAVVKADAYGHGLVPVARAAVEAGADRLGIGSVEEAIRLREAGIDIACVKLVPGLPDEIEASLAAGIEEMACDVRTARMISRTARRLKTTARVHVNIDTGMGRQGVLAGRAVETVAAIHRLAAVEIAGVMTHFPDADAGDESFTRDQIRIFTEIVQDIRDLGVRPETVHAANSAGMIHFPESRFSMVRPGIAVYGAEPTPRSAAVLPLEPVMSFRTRVGQGRELPAGSSVSYGRTHMLSRTTRIATLPVGYSDGVFRSLGNRGSVLIRGRRHPIVGRVTMNALMVQLVEGVPVEAGDEAVLLGRQGDEVIRAEEMAEWAGTIPYEIFTNLGKPSSRKTVMHRSGEADVRPH